MEFKEGWNPGSIYLSVCAFANDFTVQKKLQENGSPAAIIDTDENRTYFLIDILCHPDFLDDPIEVDDTVNDTVNEQLTERHNRIIEIMKKSPSIKGDGLMNALEISIVTLRRELAWLRNEGYIAREGSDKTGVWVVLSK